MLLKLATGVILDASKADVIHAVGPYQYGALMECGADRMVYNLRSMALAAPHKLFIATDIQNAFGTVNRATAVGALLMYLPAFVPIMSVFWGLYPHGSLHSRLPLIFCSTQGHSGSFSGRMSFHCCLLHSPSRSHRPLPTTNQGTLS